MILTVKATNATLLMAFERIKLGFILVLQLKHILVSPGQLCSVRVCVCVVRIRLLIISTSSEFIKTVYCKTHILSPGVEEARGSKFTNIMSLSKNPSGFIMVRLEYRKNKTYNHRYKIHDLYLRG